MQRRRERKFSQHNEKGLRNRDTTLLESRPNFVIGGEKLIGELLRGNILDFSRPELLESGLQRLHGFPVILDGLAFRVPVIGLGIEGTLLVTGSFGHGGVELRLRGIIAAGSLRTHHVEQDHSCESPTTEGGQKLVFLDPTHNSEGKMLINVT